MTEQEWMACTDPTPMLGFLMNGRASERKAKLFAVACNHRIWHLLTDRGSRQALEVVERYADGLASEEELESAVTVALEPVLARSFCSRKTVSATEAVPGAVWYAANRAISWEKTTIYVADMTARATADSVAERKAQAALLLDIFNPLCCDLLSLVPAWRTPKVVALAQAIYDARTFDRMPELADALQKAGCDNSEILAHCRGPGPHVRGCWVVDLLLGKE